MKKVNFVAKLLPFFIMVFFCSCSGIGKLNNHQSSKGMRYSDWRYIMPKVTYNNSVK